MPEITPCPHCPKDNPNPRRAPGQLCYSCEAARKRKTRAESRFIYEKNLPRFFRPLNSTRYIITSAQNATPVDSNCLEVLKRAADHLEAELVIVPLRYKNPTSMYEFKKHGRYANEKEEEDLKDEWWDPAVEPYLYNQRKKLHPHLVLAADVKSQPTAINPLTGFEGLTGTESCIIPHPKMALESIAVPSSSHAKILTTTGACTKRHYSDTRAGKLGEFHHFLGGIIVETTSKFFHLRQLNADREDGSFIDLDKLYTIQGVKKAPRALALVMGDVHVRIIDDIVDKATFGKGGIVDTLDPEIIVVHDLIDGSSVNPHEWDNPFLQEAKRRAQKQDVFEEIKEVVAFLKSRIKNRKVVIVDSNHHDFLKRWIIKTDWKHDLKNAAFYLETAQAMLASAKWTKQGPEFDDPFVYWIRKLAADQNVKCLNPNEPFKVADIECSLHGHRGPNGAKGTLSNLSKIGGKVMSGHGHGPGIKNGHYRVGTSTPRQLNYNLGPGNWLNTHGVIDGHGKRALITILGEGEWHG